MCPFLTTIMMWFDDGMWEKVGGRRSAVGVLYILHTGYVAWVGKDVSALLQQQAKSRKSGSDRNGFLFEPLGGLR